MLAQVLVTAALTATTPGAILQDGAPADAEVAPVQVIAPRRPAAKSHQQVVADRWSTHIVACRGVLVKNIGVVRRVCVTNRGWELEGQRVRHTLMQAQWHWVN
jgi:hypothetical protein